MTEQRKIETPTRKATLQYRGYTTRDGYAALDIALPRFGAANTAPLPLLLFTHTSCSR